MALSKEYKQGKKLIEDSLGRKITNSEKAIVHTACLAYETFCFANNFLIQHGNYNPENKNQFPEVGIKKDAWQSWLLALKELELTPRQKRLANKGSEPKENPGESVLKFVRRA